jgi:hypothetical protein
MRRWARWVVLTVVIVGAVWFVWNERVKGVQQRTRDAVYDAKLEQLRKAYPVGTPRGAVVRRLGQEPNLGEVGEVEVLLGSDPTGGWVCSRWDVYAQFVFGNAGSIDAEPLVRIKKRGSGICL